MCLCAPSISPVNSPKYSGKHTPEPILKKTATAIQKVTQKLMSLSSDVPDLILCDFNQSNMKSLSYFFWLICCSTRLHKTNDLWFLQRSVTPPPLLITTLSFSSQHSSLPLLERGKVGTREEALLIGNAAEELKGPCDAQTAMF